MKKEMLMNHKTWSTFDRHGLTTNNSLQLLTSALTALKSQLEIAQQDLNLLKKLRDQAEQDPLEFIKKLQDKVLLYWDYKANKARSRLCIFQDCSKYSNLLGDICKNTA